jgi:hypothetical protein
MTVMDTRNGASPMMEASLHQERFPIVAARPIALKIKPNRETREKPMVPIMAVNGAPVPAPPNASKTIRGRAMPMPMLNLMKTGMRLRTRLAGPAGMTARSRYR